MATKKNQGNQGMTNFEVSSRIYELQKKIDTQIHEIGVLGDDLNQENIAFEDAHKAEEQRIIQNDKLLKEIEDNLNYIKNKDHQKKINSLIPENDVVNDIEWLKKMKTNIEKLEEDSKKLRAANIIAKYNNDKIEALPKKERSINVPQRFTDRSLFHNPNAGADIKNASKHRKTSKTNTFLQTHNGFQKLKSEMAARTSKTNTMSNNKLNPSSPSSPTGVLSSRDSSGNTSLNSSRRSSVSGTGPRWVVRLRF